MSSIHADSYEKLKVRFRPLFVACQVTLRQWPGGGSEVWRALDRHIENTWVQFNPDQFGAGPSLLTFLEMLDYTQSRRIAHELGDISGHITLPSPASRSHGASRAQAVEALGAAIRPVLYNLDEFNQRDMTSVDRQARQEDLLRLIDAAHVLLRRISL